MKKKNPVKSAPKKAAKQTPAKKAAKKAPPTTPHPLKAVAKAVADTTPKPTPEQRRRACLNDLSAILEKHRCQLFPALNEPKAVGGTDGSPCAEMIISAAWAVLPLGD